MPALFYFLFWQQCLLFSLVAGSPLRVFMPAVWRAIFVSVPTLRRVAAVLASDVQRSALVGGNPPLTCFHVLSCGLISSASITRTGLGATHVSCAPTRSAGAVASGRLSLRMLECRPRNVIRSQAGSPAGPRSPASYVSHTRFRRGTQATELLSSRSRTDT